MTQAINLANFSNSLDSSGQVAPTVLNAPVPISKGGTGATTTAAAATALAAAFGNLLFPVGSIYTNASNSTNPATLLGFGTWVLFANGRVLVAYDGGTFTAGSYGGYYNTQVPYHQHTITNQYTNAVNLTHTHSGAVNPVAFSYSGGGNTQYSAYTTNTGGPSSDLNHQHLLNGATDFSGGDPTFTNMPPYLVVYMWTRTA
jgi:hypothetical protein